MSYQQNSTRCLWFTGLPCAGKTTLARGLQEALEGSGRQCVLLDGDEIRKGVNRDLGYSMADRKENIRRIAEVAKILVSRNILTICSFIAPTSEIRQMAAEIIGRERFIEIFVDTPLEECERRDVKGMYKKARSGELPEFTGISSVWEPPQHPDVTLQTLGRSESDCADELFHRLRAWY